MKRYAILFPQFHRVKVNDSAWGNGFTDWALVAAANAFDWWDRRAPARGFYDFSKPDEIQATFDGAAKAGLDGFGIYHYYFDDGPELKVIEDYLRQARLQNGFKFFFIWANESWSKRWAGKNTEIIKRAFVAPSREEVRAHVDYLIPQVRCEAYTRIGDKPMFVIYRPDFFREPAAVVEMYREEFRRAHLDMFLGLFIKCAADSQYAKHFDFCYIFEPRLFMNFYGVRSGPVAAKIYKAVLNALSYDKSEMLFEHMARLLNRGSKKHTFEKFLAYFASPERQSLLDSIGCPAQDVLTCGWNNAPRYRERFTELETPTRDQIEQMLDLSTGTHRCSPNIPLLCNAWNEWSEGAAIEPCSYLGDALLKGYIRSHQRSDMEVPT